MTTQRYHRKRIFYLEEYFGTAFEDAEISPQLFKIGGALLRLVGQNFVG